MNKTVIQCIHFAVECHQKGWPRVLDKIRFDIMNTVNVSTGFTPFQLRFGKSPQLLPPMIRHNHETEEETTAANIIAQMKTMKVTAQDNLLTAKIWQATQANKQRDLTFPFHISERVLLSTFHRQCEYKTGEEPRVAKFMPRFDGPYRILATDDDHSTVTLDMPNTPHILPTFHTSELHVFRENDAILFPSRALQPPSLVTINGDQEFYIDKIVDERCHG